MKKTRLIPLLILLGVISILLFNVTQKEKKTQDVVEVVFKPYKKEKKKKKTLSEKYEDALARQQFEYDLLKDPSTGEISREQRAAELDAALELYNNPTSRTSTNNYVSRGPSNFGGRTRSVIVDISDPSSNTLLAGGVSSGVFRTTNGGADWVRVSSNTDIHNVTALAQDPRPGFQNIMYYGTGEFAGNSASLGSFFFGQGIYESNDGGLSWEVIPETSSVFQNFDSDFDIVHSLVVSPTTGNLLIATINSIYSYDGAQFSEILIADSQAALTFTDVTIDASGRIYAAIGGDENNTNGVYLSEDNGDSFVRISQNGNPAGWFSPGRTVLATAPSNDNLIYALFDNGASSANNQVEADLWRYDRSTGAWTDFTSTLPNLPGGPVQGIDPFSIQGGFDLVVRVHPTDENFVIIGGTSAYKIENIETDQEFEQIGGYNGVTAGLYNTANGDLHHPDIHALLFDPFNPNVFFSGTDGGVHRTDDINADVVDWVNLNNNYLTYQYYDVFLDQAEGSNLVIGGAQDNGTTAGGTDGGLPNNTEMVTLFGGDGVSVSFGRTANSFLGYFGFQNGAIFRQNFTTQGFLSIRPSQATADGLFVTLFGVDPDNTETLYYASQNRLFRTNNASTVNPTSWVDLGPIAGGQTIRSFATTRGTYNPTSSYLLIGGQNGGVFRVDDPQNATGPTDAINITPAGASTAGGSIVSAMAVHPTDPDIAIAVYANFGIPSIYITSDATSDDPQWSLVERNLAPFSIRSAQILSFNGETQYYVGTARGLYSNPDPLTTDWSPEGVGQIGIPIVSDLEYRPSDNVLLLGTHGNGMFDTNVTTLSTEDFSGDTVEDGLRAFPNPATTQLNFQVTTGGTTMKAYQVIDYSGRVIDQQAIGNLTQSTLDVSRYTTGVYFLRVVTQNDNVVITQFIKQ